MVELKAGFDFDALLLLVRHPENVQVESFCPIAASVCTVLILYGVTRVIKFYRFLPLAKSLKPRRVNSLQTIVAVLP